MKFAVCFLLAGFCLVAVNAATVSDVEQGLLIPEEPVEIDGQTLMIFDKFFWVAWKALRALKGINCSIKEVIHIKNEVLSYPLELLACKVEITEPLNKVIRSMEEIGVICDNILNLNSKVCNRANPSDDMLDEYQEIDGQTFGFFKCTFQLLKQFDALEHKLVATTKLILALPDATFKVGGCMVKETEDIVSLFTGFPGTIKTCSQLKS